jgi:hypothetical protein
MKKYIFYIVFVTLFAGCGKSGGGGTTPTPEASLVFTTNPDPGSNIFAALSANQDIGVSITSSLPAAGVTVDVMVTKDLDNSTVFSQSLTNTVPNFTVAIQNLTSGVVCTTVITVTSKSTVF